MQVQLIVADEHRCGQAIPINVPSFMIGRAEGCNLRSLSPQVSRFHCTIAVNNDTVIVQDLGGENGTFVNGNRVSSAQTLNNGDKLVVGSHSFMMSIKPGVVKVVSGGQGANQDDFFELTASSVSQLVAEQSDPTRSADPKKTAIMKEKAKKPEQEAEVMFEIRLDGQRVSVGKSRLFDLARRGFVLPDDLVVVAGTKVFADSIQGIVFGDKSSPAPPPLPPPTAPSLTGSGVRASAAPAPQPTAVSDADPFAFADGEVSPFDNVTSEPFVRVARKESAFGAIWSALDISFSRVYTKEGNNLVIHSLKALYVIIAVICLLVVFFMWLDVARQCYEAYGADGNVLAEFMKNFMPLAFVTFGCVLIIVVVRILLEMFLLAWIESAKADQEKEDDE